MQELSQKDIEAPREPSINPSSIVATALLAILLLGITVAAIISR
jgi:hypothetical protein